MQKPKKAENLPARPRRDQTLVQGTPAPRKPPPRPDAGEDNISKQPPDPTSSPHAPQSTATRHHLDHDPTTPKKTRQLVRQ